MNRRRILFAASFLAAFLAGLVLAAAVTGRARNYREDRLAAELDLDADQAAKVHEIWSSAMKESRRIGREGFEKIRSDREEAIRALLDEDKIAKYDEILDNERTAREDLEARRAKLFDNAVAETNKLLNDEQRLKYEEFLAKERSRRESRKSPDRKPQDAGEKPQ